MALEQAQIEELLQRAAMLRRQCDERDKIAAPLLAQLEVLEEISFDWLKHDPMIDGRPHWTNAMKPRQQTRVLGRDYRSLSEQDRAEAADLDRKAQVMTKDLSR